MIHSKEIIGTFINGAKILFDCVQFVNNRAISLYCC